MATPLNFYDWFKQSPYYSNYVQQYGDDPESMGLNAYPQYFNQWQQYANDPSQFGYTQAQLQGMQSNLGSDRAGGGQSFTKPLQAINPATGQLTNVYSAPGEDQANGDPSLRYFLQGAQNVPQGATQAMAGGYSSGEGTDPMEIGILAGLGAIAGGAALGLDAAAAAPATTTSASAPTLLAAADTGITSDVTAGTLGASIGGGGSGLSASAGTADVMGTGGSLTDGIYSSAGGSGLIAGSSGGAGLSVTPGVSAATGWGGATGATSASAAAPSGFGAIINSLGGMGNIIGTGATLYGLNQMSNSYRNLANQASNYSSLDQPQRAPYQQNLYNLVNNPQDYLTKDPYATSLAALYKNQIIPRNIAQSGNPASVLDTQGSQFVNALSGNYNTQVGNLSGIAGFGFPQSAYAGSTAAQLGAGAANAQGMQTAALGNLLGQNIGKMQGQSGSTGIFGTAWG